MPEQRLRSTIEELERELELVDSLDPETRKLLEDAVAEIQGTLRQPADGPEAATARDSVSQRLTAAAQDFESSHPALGGILSRIIDLLGQIGI